MDANFDSGAIYRTCTATAWQAAIAVGVYEGSEKDKQDGFIHFSKASQVRAVVVRHYAEVADLVLLTVDPDKLGNALKWEISHNDELYPHLYGPLSVTLVFQVDPLTLGPDGGHVFPPGFP